MRNPAHVLNHLEGCIQIATCDCDSVLELGCGTGDKLAATGARMMCGVEIHKPYLQLARNRWPHKQMMLHCADAVKFVGNASDAKNDTGIIHWDAILMIDFIEHLKRRDGRVLLRKCRNLARRRVIVYCPEAYFPQDKDSFGLGGEKFQRHQSAWFAVDFESRGFDVARWEDKNGPGKHALFSVWNQP